MTRRCIVCEKEARYKCKFCGDSLCKEHLPLEKHWCIKHREKGIGRAFEERKEKDKAFSLAFLSQNFSFLLLLLISLSFALQLFIPDYTKLFILNPPLIKEKPWTLITSIFLHGSFGHLFFNMLFFIFFAPILERKIGSSKFLFIFFLSGIVAGIGYSLTYSNPVLGASGALYGIFGALAMLIPRMKVYFFFFLPLEMWMAVVLFAIIDFLMIPSGDMIAHTAHLSGLFVGLLFGMIFKKNRFIYYI